MDSRIMQTFQKEITCPICMKYFIDPVTLDCGHSFCRPCLYLGWHDILVLAPCYVCKEMVEKRDFKTNVRMKKLASLARKATLWQFLSSEEHMCGAHKEMKKIFCEEDKSLLCVLCSNSQEHEAHRHWQIECAAEQHRENLLKKMHSVWEKYCESHRNLIMEMMTMDSWEAYGDTVHRIESMQLYVAQPLNPELSVGPITGLIDRLNCFRMDITLYPERAHSHVFLHGELRSVLVGCDPQGASWNTPTSECFLAWGTQTFTDGRYYWELDVGDCWNWALGICNDDWKENREDKMHDVEGLFLLGCVKEGTRYTLFTTSPLVLHYIPRPIGQIGVFLDCNGRTVSFINVAQSSLIHSIPHCSFSPRLKSVFCCSHF
uniref:Uncharacterized protein n=1 Tax=Sciurus vulgaris TaxID=55149 RepID=A0A8D2DS48_SCIVU